MFTRAFKSCKTTDYSQHRTQYSVLEATSLVYLMNLNCLWEGEFDQNLFTLCAPDKISTLWVHIVSPDYTASEQKDTYRKVPDIYRSIRSRRQIRFDICRCSFLLFIIFPSIFFALFHFLFCIDMITCNFFILPLVICFIFSYFLLRFSSRLSSNVYLFISIFNLIDSFHYFSFVFSLAFQFRLIHIDIYLFSRWC